MKKNIISAYFLISVASLHAQTPGKTYIQTRTYLEPVSATNSNAKQIREIKYLDGLARVKQIVSVKASPGNNDVVAKVEYDGFGNQLKNYLPIPQDGTSNGNFYDNPLTYASNINIYGNEKIYSESKYENSPLNRIQQTTNPGISWADKPIKYIYETNSVGEVNKYVASVNISSFDSSVVQSGSYSANSLFKNSTTDEDENVVIEYKNGNGQIILSRKIISSTEKADTYYVYNDYNQLAFVITPMAAHAPLSADNLNNFCYQYKYDHRNRLIEQKNPGRGWEFFVYDKQDRVVLSQDPSLQTLNNNFNKKGWLFNKYDQFGRIVYTGFFANTASRSSMQTAINNMSVNPANNEVRSSAFFTLNGLDIYYTKNAFPTGSMTILSVNYYDSYPNEAPSANNQIMGQDILPSTPGAVVSTKSLKVASFIKNIEDDAWTKTFLWYDKKGRVVSVYTKNHLGGFDRTDSKLDFTGNVMEVITKQKLTDSDIEKIVVGRFEYDHQNRIKVQKHQVDSNPEEIIAQYDYNELSQIKSKKVGGKILGAGLQVIDYKYNIRGWLTQINDPSTLGNKLIGFKINYNTRDGLETPNSDFLDLKIKPKFNGAISEVLWKTATVENEPLKIYGYSYDSASRMTAGFYQSQGNELAKEYYEVSEYDLNGNIKKLHRSEGVVSANIAQKIDKLKYDYIGNRLVKITDEQENPSGYPYFSIPNTIQYDNGNLSGNGNMTSHMDKGIASIKYNHLNLPNFIIQNNILTKYTYRSDGAKVKKVYGNIETYYINGFQYKSTKPSEGIINTGGLVVEPDPNEVAVMKLRVIPTSEGYYDVVNNQYIYNYKDHLGNVRLSYTDNDKDGIIHPRQYHVTQCSGFGFNQMCIDYWKPGEIVEVNNYYPFGLQHNYTATTQNAYQYKFNGKELQESGMYDYGARFYMPDIGRWGVLDPLMHKYTPLSPYSYVANNPVNAVDPDGRKILFVNGYYQRNLLGKWILGSDKAGEEYWGHNFPLHAKFFFDDFAEIKNSNYIDGSSFIGGDMSGEDRYNAGYTYAKEHINELTANMAKGETFKIITHSEGSAFGAGVARYLIDKGHKVSDVIHLSSDEGDEFTTPSEPETYQLVYNGDLVTGNKKISGVDKFGIVDSGLGTSYVHGSTRNKGVFKQVQDLKTVRTTLNIGTVNGKTKTWSAQDSASTKNNTSFTRINDLIISNNDGTKK